LTVSSANLRGALTTATLVYLALPVAVFLLGWLRPTLGLASTALLAVAVGSAIRDGRRAPRPPDRMLSPTWLAASAVPVALVFAVAVVGVALDASGDWSKHLELFRDLLRQPWPVAYETSAGPAALVYYVAWYLPAVVVAGLTGWQAGLIVLLLWSALGALLVAGWVVVLVRAQPLLATAVFVLFAGVEIWQNLLGEGLWQTLVEVAEGDSFTWQGYFWYQTIQGCFYKIPNQAFAGWLLAALVMDAADRRDVRFPAVLVLALSLLWSPFVSVGLAPLVGIPVLCARASWAERIRAQLGLANLAGAVTGLVLAAYFAARFSPFALPDAYVTGFASSYDGPWLVKAGVEPLSFLRTWIVFAGIHFLGLSIPLLLAQRVWRGLEPRAALTLAATLFLLLLPHFRYGWYNDLSHRASVPALFVLLVLAIDLLGHARRHPLAVSALALYLGLAQITAVGVAVRNVETLRRLWPERPVAPEPERDLFARHLDQEGFQWRKTRRSCARNPATCPSEAGAEGLDRGFAFLPQYLGSLDAPFFRYLAKPAEARRISEPAPDG
jgi:hypothetical protein